MMIILMRMKNWFVLSFFFLNCFHFCPVVLVVEIPEIYRGIVCVAGSSLDI